jgi:hypothetical protein
MTHANIFAGSGAPLGRSGFAGSCPCVEINHVSVRHGGGAIDLSTISEVTIARMVKGVGHFMVSPIEELKP